MLFSGSYDHTIDAKSRLAIPAPMRAKIQREAGIGEGEPVSLYVTLDRDRCLTLYTESGFERRAAQLDGAQLPARELLEYERLFFSTAEQIELDKQGRIRLPESLLKWTRLKTEVKVLGVNDRIEVRPRDEWDAHLSDTLEHHPERFMSPREAIDVLGRREADEESRAGMPTGR